MNWCVVHPCANSLGEGPHWDARGQSLWWVDVVTSKLWRFTPSTDTVDSWDSPRHPACIAQHSDQEIYVVGRNWLSKFDPSTAHWTPLDIAGLNFDVERFNDGRVDAKGRWWVGSMDKKLQAPIGGLYQLGPGGNWSRKSDGIELGNGIGWSPDSRWMYVTDTPAQTISRHAFDLDTGALGPREQWVTVPSGAGGPDGLAVDSQGCVWSAQFDRACVNRYSPEGELIDTLAVPAPRPTSVTFGGPDLKTLFVTTAAMGLSEQQLSAYPNSGHLFSIQLDVSGLHEHPLRPVF